MGKYSFGFSQLNAGIREEGPLGNTQTRSSSMRMSNFGAIRYGARSSTDYTSIDSTVKDKIVNPKVPDLLYDQERNVAGAINTPFEVGSAVKRITESPMLVMSSLGSASRPKEDIMDTYASSQGSFSGYLPMEGWRPWGYNTSGATPYEPVPMDEATELTILPSPWDDTVIWRDNYYIWSEA
jgi:hypothetical protein